MPEENETDFIVLKKIPYMESYIIVNGLSPDMGRMGFIFRSGATQMGDVDLFKLLHVGYKKGRGDLYWFTSVELLEDFSSLAKKYERYQAALWLSQFTLNNVMPNLAHPHYSNALEVALRRLSNGACCLEAILSGALLAFVFEEGWLAHILHSKEAASQCRQILEMAAGAEIPQISDESWKKQLEWIQQILLANDCKLP